MNEDMKEKSRLSVDRIIAKIKRCIEPLKQHVTPEGRLDESDQHAVRILESRIRFLERMWALLYGSHQEQENAKIELVMVTKRDDGTLVQIGEKRHGQGRLDCRACDTNENHQPLTRLCRNCQAGIQHAYTERCGGYAEIPPQGVGEPIPEPEMNGLGPRYTGAGAILAIVQHRCCDSCGHDDMEMVGYEYPEPEKERWRQVML